MGKITKCMRTACTAVGMIAMSGLVASGAAVYSVAVGFQKAGKMVMASLREEGKENDIILTHGADDGPDPDVEEALPVPAEAAEDQADA